MAGINITSYALGLLQSGKLDLELYRGGATKEASEGIFGGFGDSVLSQIVLTTQTIAYLFTIFARSWNERRGPERLTVLDFNRVFADIKTAFERDLSSGTGLAFASGSKKSN